MLEFIENTKTELFTLTGVIIGGTIGFVGQILALRMSNKENLRKERAETARSLYKLMSDLYSALLNIDSTIQYSKVSKQELDRYLKTAQSAMHQFSDYYINSKINIPTKAEKILDEFHKYTISTLLDVERNIRVMVSGKDRNSVDLEQFNTRRSGWNRNFAEVRRRRDSAYVCLRRIVEGRLK